MNHPLHEKIGEALSQQFKEDFVMDTACGGKHALPLFRDKKSKKTEFCRVDGIIIKDGKVKIIFEIEEANIKPTQACGKFLASALSQYYDYGKKRYGLDDSAMFIQVLDTSKLKENSMKKEQWSNLEKAIQNIIPVKESRIKKYKLYYFCVKDDFGAVFKEIKEFLGNGKIPTG